MLRARRGSARSGDLEKARKAEARLNQLYKTLEATDGYWAKQVQIQQNTVNAWIAFAEGKQDQALKMMTAVAALEDTTEKHAVTPGVIMPAHELVAEMLLERDDETQAQIEFEKALQVSPNRRHQAFHKTAKSSSNND